MEDITYANAFSEVLDILFYLSDAEYNRIPKKFIQMLEENKNPESDFEYNPNKTLDEQGVSEEAKAIIALICRDYLVDKEERERIIQREKEELAEEERIRREQFNPDNIFKKQTKTVQEENDKVEEIQMTTYKEPFLKRVISKILNFFHKK